MQLKKQQKSALDRIVDSIAQVEGVAGIILFGSQARGDYDELSDYDVLILFEDKNVMWKTWPELFRVVASLKMDLHAIPETLDELKNANPVFLDELYKFGRVLYAKTPFEVRLQPLNMKPFTLITYDMSKSSYPDKMKASYFLYSKEGIGAVRTSGGTKISDGCVIVPAGSSQEIIQVLNSLGVRTAKTEVMANPVVIRENQLLRVLPEVGKHAGKRKTKVDSTGLIREDRKQQSFDSEG